MSYQGRFQQLEELPQYDDTEWLPDGPSGPSHAKTSQRQNHEKHQGCSGNHIMMHQLHHGLVPQIVEPPLVDSLPTSAQVDGDCKRRRLGETAGSLEAPQTFMLDRSADQDIDMTDDASKKPRIELDEFHDVAVNLEEEDD